MELQKPPWVEYFTYLALGASMRSKDPKTQVGCVIVDSVTLKILSIGYNGFPLGISNSDESWSDEQKNNLVVHAEANAVILKGTANLENSIAFVTLFPCEDCAKMLIQAGVRRVYYLSFRDKYGQSEEIFKEAKVDMLPVKRGDDDDTLSMFQNTFIDMVKAAIQNVTNTKVDDSSRQLCNSLKKKKKIKNLRKRDIKSRWKRNPPGQRSDEILFKKWTHYFLFLAHVASTRSSCGAKDGALLVDCEKFKMCSLSYKGYPRDVEGTSDDAMVVSAIMNVLALRFCEGNEFYAFCTNFPREEEVKNLAQAEVKHFYFISPTNMTTMALSILDAAKVKTVPMDPLDEKEIEKEIINTIKGLTDKEEKNTISFQHWPKTEGIQYELKPKRRNSGLD
ncbi:uncharacterized protein LOC110053809 isoform X1 [Orbicella faveolata]|uniref:uncharacterized protein LOC110053809 isoform X1 n=1 Tax=Orbicella faveolata TaxID=48498 RepID=UPI0009E3A5C8|nr:uncharacterized protein LOC110053809 isoform X1 [Orbicella faveolata]